MLLKWFKHNSDASMDAKLKRLKMKYGMEGYGLYWYCLELIAREVSATKLNFELEHDAEIIAHDTGIYVDRVQEMMRYMIELDLFEDRGGMITCLRMAHLSDEYTVKALRNAKALSGQTPDSIRTKSVLIDKKRTDKNNRGFAPPTREQVMEYSNTSGHQVDADSFIDFYESKGWMVGKNKMKSWQAAVRNWARSNASKPAVDAIWSDVEL